jgi:hypothetical protein
MTRQDALEILSDVKTISFAYDSAYSEALSMAMEGRKAAEPRVIRPEEYAGWEADAWAEDRETGHVTALDRGVVRLFAGLVLNEEGLKRLWTGRPTEERRLAEPW